MCLNEVLSVIDTGCDCLCVCDCGCMSEMGMSMCPGSYDLACISMFEVVCLRLCFDDRVWLCIRGCWCSLQTLLMPFAPKEEGHYLSPSRSEGSEAVCSQGQPPCLPHRCTSERVQAGAEKPLETSCSKTKVKSTTMIPDCQKLLRCELESLRCQLQAQTKVSQVGPTPSNCLHPLPLHPCSHP